MAFDRRSLITGLAGICAGWLAGSYRGIVATSERPSVDCQMASKSYPSDAEVYETNYYDVGNQWCGWVQHMEDGRWWGNVQRDAGVHGAHEGYFVRRSDATKLVEMWCVPQRSQP